MKDYRLFYSPDYYADIGENHVFPIKKFELAKDILLGEGTLASHEVVAPEPVNKRDLLRVHTEDYISRLQAGDLTKKEVRRLGLPWSEALVRRSLLAVSGTIGAARSALENGISSNLAGGTHHAFPDRGEGFCVLNDIAVAVEVVRSEGLAKRFLIVDCDVHQGNGTAFIFADDESVFTFSMHGGKNYPCLRRSRTWISNSRTKRVMKHTWKLLARPSYESTSMYPIWYFISPEPIPSNMTSSGGFP